MDQRARRLEILNRWKAHRQTYTYCLMGDKNFIEPYILSRKTYGYPVDLLVGTEQGQNWYDKLDVLREFELLLQFGMINPGDVVFDCGAHHGYYAVLFSKMVGSQGRVHSFEPFPILTDLIQFNLELNDVHNVELHRVGLSSKAEPRKGSLNGENVGFVLDGDAVDIELDILDHYAHLRPNFVKLDVEGAEVDALQGATQLLKQAPNLYIEIHTQFLPHFKRQAMEIFNYLPSDRYQYILDYPDAPLLRYNREFPLEKSCALYCIRREIDFWHRTTLEGPTALTMLSELIRKQKDQTMEIAARLSQPAVVAPTPPTAEPPPPQRSRIRRLLRRMWS